MINNAYTTDEVVMVKSPWSQSRGREAYIKGNWQIKLFMPVIFTHRLAMCVCGGFTGNKRRQSTEKDMTDSGRGATELKRVGWGLEVDGVKQEAGSGGSAQYNLCSTSGLQFLKSLVVDKGLSHSILPRRGGMTGQSALTVLVCWSLWTTVRELSYY